MIKKSKPVSTTELLQFFPEVELPVVFSDETLSVFSNENDPLPNHILQTVITEIEGDIDEYTEYIPCAKIDTTDDYIAVVYWKGGLLKYEFVLITLDARSAIPALISRKVIASTISDNEVIKKSVASIDSDMIVHIIAGENLIDSEYSADHSQAFTMEIQSTGDILFSFVE